MEHRGVLALHGARWGGKEGAARLTDTKPAARAPHAIAPASAEAPHGGHTRVWAPRHSAPQTKPASLARKRGP
eukprot:14192841-Alexandrium_andersonii.AAC.1